MKTQKSETAFIPRLTPCELNMMDEDAIPSPKKPIHHRLRASKSSAFFYKFLVFQGSTTDWQVKPTDWIGVQRAIFWEGGFRSGRCDAVVL
jgi:hypothetical protein